MKKTNGFTLVELLGVVLVLSAICLVVFPPIIDQIKKSKNSIDEATQQLIFTASELFVDANQNDYPKVNGNAYCITLQQLVDEDLLKEPLKDMKTNEEIPLTRNVKIKVSNKKYQFEFMGSNDCTQTK